MKSHVTAETVPQKSTADKCIRPQILTRKKAHAEAEPHVACGGIKNGGAGSAYDAAKDVGSEREFVLKEIAISSWNSFWASIKFTGRFRVHKRSIV